MNSLRYRFMATHSKLEDPEQPITSSDNLFKTSQAATPHSTNSSPANAAPMEPKPSPPSSPTSALTPPESFPTTSSKQLTTLFAQPHFDPKLKLFQSSLSPTSPSTKTSTIFIKSLVLSDPSKNSPKFSSPMAAIKAIVT